MLRCDCIAIIQPESFHYEIPGKLFETFKTLKPILALVNPKSETADIVNNYPLGFVCASIDINRIKSYIEYNLSTRHISEKDMEAARSYVTQFTFENMKNRLKSIVSHKF